MPLLEPISSPQKPSSFPRIQPTRRATRLCLLLIFGFAAILDLAVACSMSTTIDERDYLSYGAHILHLQPDRSFLLWNSKTPVSALNALPQVVGGVLGRHQVLSRIGAILLDPRVCRLPSLLALLLLNWLVYRWVRDLYGGFAALAACIMVTLSPNLIAHGTLSTSDGYFALGVVASLFFLRQYILRPTWRNACISALALALAQLMKPFALYLYGVVLGFMLVWRIWKRRDATPLSTKRMIGYLVIDAVIFIAVLNIGYTFRRSLTSLSAYEFKSTSFQKLQTIPLLKNVPVPVPYAFLQGLDLMRYSDDVHLTFGNIYLLGELHRVHDPDFHNFPAYYMTAIFFKEPIPLQVLFVLGIVWICRNRRWEDFLTGEALLLVAATTLILWQSLFRNSQIGIRNILPALAIEIIIAASVFANFPLLSRSKKIVMVLLLVWLAVSTASYFPHMIPYMNEWTLDRKSAYKILADSNLDWGQNQGLVQDFLSKNPDVKLNPESPVSGRVLVSANRLVGIEPGLAPLTWLVQYRPVAHVGYAHLLYVIP